MTAHDYLNFIVDEIHSTVVATVDGDGLPDDTVLYSGHSEPTTVGAEKRFYGM